jgi:hypothetical protein
MISPSSTFSATTTAGGLVVMLGLLATLVAGEARRQSNRPRLGDLWRWIQVGLLLAFAADVILRFAVLGHGI